VICNFFGRGVVVVYTCNDMQMEVVVYIRSPEQQSLNEMRNMTFEIWRLLYDGVLT
jgi:hypothetical protein